MPKQPISSAAKALSLTATTWFTLVFAGQLIFAYYILMLYWRSAIQGNMLKWNTASSHFYIKGDWVGNIVFGVHIALAAIITILGPLQLVPAMRRRFPKFHRVSGRIYIATAFFISLAGLWLTWVKGSVGGLVGSIVISFNAIIIMTCAWFAIKHAIKRNIYQHNKWAVRLFLGVSGVWMFRVFLMLWLAIFRAPVGFDPQTFTGPFLNALAIFVYVFPQVIVYFYFRAKESKKPTTKWTFTTLLGVITLAMIVGIVAATMGMWLPRL